MDNTSITSTPTSSASSTTNTTATATKRTIPESLLKYRTREELDQCAFSTTKNGDIGSLVPVPFACPASCPTNYCHSEDSKPFPPERFYNRYYWDPEQHIMFGSVYFGPKCEGPPSCAHGGSIATVLDDFCGIAAWLHASRHEISEFHKAMICHKHNTSTNTSNTSSSSSNNNNNSAKQARLIANYDTAPWWGFFTERPFDEITKCVVGELNCKFRKMLPLLSTVYLVGYVERYEQEKRKLHTRASMISKEGQLIASAQATVFVLKDQNYVARAKKSPSLKKLPQMSKM